MPKRTDNSTSWLAKRTLEPVSERRNRLTRLRRRPACGAHQNHAVKIVSGSMQRIFLAQLAVQEVAQVAHDGLGPGGAEALFQCSIVIEL